MLHKKQFRNILIAFTVIAASCEKTITVKQPAFTPVLTINCNSAAYQQMNVVVDRTASISEQANNPDLTIGTATVTLSEEGSWTEVLTPDSLLGYYSAHVTKPGKQYTIKVSAPSFSDAEATTVAPLDVAITNITRITNVRKDANGSWQDELIVTFTDPVGPGDYYILKLHSQADSPGRYPTFCVNSPDPSVESNSNDLADVNTCLDNYGIFIRDALFDGQRKDLKLYASAYDMEPQFNGVDTQYATIELQHVTEAYFRYQKSYKVAQDANDNPFAEPVNVYSNVTYGMGIFSIVNTWKTLIR